MPLSELVVMHMPPLHVVGAVHGAPLPHLQLPETQPSAKVVLHAVHVVPPGPQAERLAGVTQTLPEQHPEHEAASQTQSPPEQTWPEPQGLALPHWHAPAVEHVSEVLPQSTHVPPEAPQLPGPGVSHTAPLQHPLGHDAGSQTQPVDVHA